MRTILAADTMTFQEAVELAVARDAAANHARALQSNHSDSQPVNSIRSSGQIERKKPSNATPNNTKPNSYRARENSLQNRPRSACFGCNG